MSAAAMPSDELPKAVAQLLSRVVLRDASALQRLYQLVRQSGDIRERTFSIEFLDAPVDAYAFTFG